MLNLEAGEGTLMEVSEEACMLENPCVNLSHTWLPHVARSVCYLKATLLLMPLHPKHVESQMTGASF